MDLMNNGLKKADKPRGMIGFSHGYHHNIMKLMIKKLSTFARVNLPIPALSLGYWLEIMPTGRFSVCCYAVFVIWIR